MTEQTNAELIDKLRTHATVIPWLADAAAALEQTTRELKEAQADLDVADAKITGYRQNNGRMADTLAKVREYLHGHRAVLDSHTKFELGSILDESVSRPAPPEACPTCTGKIRETTNLVCQTCGKDYGTSSEHERPEGCCGVCPPIARGGYDCTCEDNPRCPNFTGDA